MCVGEGGGGKHTLVHVGARSCMGAWVGVAGSLHVRAWVGCVKKVLKTSASESSSYEARPAAY